MFDKLVFFNHEHNGDIHFSREFVKHLTMIPAKEYFYAHSYSHKLVADLGLKHLMINEIPLRKNESIFVYKNSLYINTWIGQDHFKYFCLVEKRGWLASNYLLYSDLINLIRKKGIRCKYLCGEMQEYIPVINHECYEIKEIKELVKSNKCFKVLICNGKVNSNAAPSLDFNNMIHTLASIYKNYLFFHTAPTRIKAHNLIYTTDFIKANNGDLNEISYLSKFCGIIIGRGSGPFCFCEIKDNYFNNKKRFIGIPGAFGNIFWHKNKRTLVTNANSIFQTFEKAINEIKLLKLL